jgi:hypothetical protein
MDTNTYEFYAAQCQTKGITPLDKKTWEKQKPKEDNISIRSAKKAITNHKKQLDEALNYE